MDDGNWIVSNLQNALNTWNEKLSEIWTIIAESPEDFKGGGIWGVILDINGALQAIGLALLVLFFVTGVMKTLGSISETKRPETAFRLFIRFVLAKGAVTYGLELMTAFFAIIQGVISTTMEAAGLASPSPIQLPDEIREAVHGLGFLASIPIWAVTFLGSLFIMVLSFIMILSVYGRFFKLYMYTAISPLPLAAFAGEPTANIGKSFLKSYAGICMEGAVIVLACVIFSVFAASPPVAGASSDASTLVWGYVGELIFNLLILVGTVKMADHICKEMLGL